MGFLGGTSGKESTCQCWGQKTCEFNPWVGKIPWRRAWQLTPVFLPGESMDRGACQATVWGGGVARVTKSQTRLKRLNMHILISTVYHHSQHPTWPAFWTASVIQKSLGFFKCRQIQVHFALCYILKYWTLTEFHKFKLEKFTKGIVTEFFCKINHCFQYE